MSKIYATRDEAINQAIIPALDDADAYDLDAIAYQEMFDCLIDSTEFIDSMEFVDE